MTPLVVRNNRLAPANSPRLIKADWQLVRNRDRKAVSQQTAQFQHFQFPL
jgi:hypothetical protein